MNAMTATAARTQCGPRRNIRTAIATPGAETKKPRAANRRGFSHANCAAWQKSYAVVTAMSTGYLGRCLVYAACPKSKPERSSATIYIEGLQWVGYGSWQLMPQHPTGSRHRISAFGQERTLADRAFVKLFRRTCKLRCCNANIEKPSESTGVRRCLMAIANRAKAK